MIENIIKKMLRKWLKKKVFAPVVQRCYFSREANLNAARFDWVYNAPLKEWRDRIWVISHADGCGDKTLDEVYYNYLIR